MRELAIALAVFALALSLGVLVSTLVHEADQMELLSPEELP